MKRAWGGLKRRLLLLLLLLLMHLPQWWVLLQAWGQGVGAWQWGSTTLAPPRTPLAPGH